MTEMRKDPNANQPDFNGRDSLSDDFGENLSLYLAGREMGEDAGDPRLLAALARKPQVTIPPDFAARVAAQTLRQVAESAREDAPRSAHRPFRFIFGWGLTATICSMALLVLLMFHYAGSPQGPAKYTAEVTLALEFVLVLLGLIRYRGLFEQTLHRSARL